MLLSITQYGDAVLRTKCAPVPKIDEGIVALANNMLETMYAAEGIGLAAPQVDVSLQLVVIDSPQQEEDPEETVTVNGEEKPMASIMPLLLINPVLEPYGAMGVCNEGCLSVRGIRANVQRPDRVRARFTMLDGSSVELDCGGLLARCLQHECDHLNGVVFTDRVSSAAKLTLAKKLKRLAAER